MGIAIITGASSGLGAEFCRALDTRGLDCIWMIARREDALQELSSELRTPSRVLKADLSSHQDFDRLIDTIRSEKPVIDFLVNCAGLGRFGKPWTTAREEVRAMIEVNVLALVEITDTCIPFMLRGSSIIEVCSLSAYLPLEELNVYSASKSFVRSYTQALRKETRDRGISVLEVSPGWIKTGFIEKSIASEDIPAKVFRHAVTKENVVAKAMKDLERNRKISVCGSFNRMQMLVCRHLPAVASVIWKQSLRKK